MKKLSFLWTLAAVGVLITSCSSDEVVMPEKQDGKTASIKTDVSLQEAREDLESLLSDLNEAETRSGESTRKVIAECYTSTLAGNKTRSSEQNRIPIHVFNFENNQGYAVMSGDSRYPSLIALAEEGSYDEAEIMSNPGTNIYYGNFDGWTWEPTHPADPNPGWIGSTEYPVYGEWTNTIYSPNGMCKVKWGQGTPDNPTYNKFCSIKKGKRCKTGCVATALSQFMSIYKYPASYDGYFYDWNAMTEYPTYGFVSGKAQNDIARLMEQVGRDKNLNMNYGLESSGADTKNCIRTLKAFGYSNGGSMNDYNTQTVVSELKNGYPVIIRGNSHKKVILGINTYSDGHAWVGHGLLVRSREKKIYDSKTNQYKYTLTETYYYILCNWGWNRTSDGYYLSNVFNATEGPIYNDDGTPTRANDHEAGYDDYNFQYKIEAITGIRK